MVNHKKLIQKLAKYGLAPKLTKLLENYLENRKQLTVINGTKSSIRDVGYGVPQGSVIGPQLLTLFINDITNHVIHSNIQMYVEDIVLYNTVKNNMNAM